MTACNEKGLMWSGYILYTLHLLNGDIMKWNFKILFAVTNIFFDIVQHGIKYRNILLIARILYFIKVIRLNIHHVQ